MKLRPRDRLKFRTTLQAVLVLCAVSAGSKLLPASEKIVDRWDLAVYDLMMKKLAAKNQSISEVATVAITSEDLTYYRHNSRMGWPWRRALYNHIIGYCKKGDAKALMFDLLFTDDSAEAGDDSAFAEGLSSWDKVYIVGEFQDEAPKGIQLEGQETTDEYAKKFAIPVEIKDSRIKIREVKYIRFPVESILEVNSNIVDATETPDFDGKTRRYTLVSRYKDYYFPSPALRMLWDAHGRPPISIERGYLNFGPFHIPVDENCAMTLKYYGPGRTTFKTYEARELIQNNYLAENEPEKKPTFPPESLKGKIVLVGTYFPGMDVKKVPVDLSYPGVETHATAVANMLGVTNGSLSGDHMKEIPRLWVIIWSIAYIPIACFTFRYIRPSFVKYTLYGLFGIHAVVVIILFRQNIWAGAMPQIMAVLSSYITSIALSYVQEGKQKALVKKTFQSYVSPTIVNKILDKSDQLTLLGERKKLTVMFLDFEGFTTISERLPPEEIVAVLKKYFTRISNEVFATEGVIDKFIGDAVIAFWGDPLPQEDNALRACRSAILISKAMAELRADNPNPLNARIGINTGEVVVGNMGSDKLFNYTVIGDEVNFTSRLEGANKQFGTKILISESTLKAAGDTLIVREVGPVRVKGKQKAVRVYELAGVRGETELMGAEQVSSYNEALSLFKEGRYVDALKGFSTIASAWPEDGLAIFYRDLTKELAENGKKQEGEYVHKLTAK